MKTVINIVLLLIMVFLAYTLYGVIKEPVVFNQELQKRKEAVSGKMKNIRAAQQVHELAYGEYAKNFASLKENINNGEIAVIAVTGDEDDVNFTGEIIRDTTIVSALDSLRGLGYDITDDMEVIPFSDNKKFNMFADTVTYQKTLVNVIEVTAKYSDFMGKFADKRYSRFDNSYDPEAVMKFGDRTKPNVSGNWE